jgi:hypothetical protein
MVIGNLNVEHLALDKSETEAPLIVDFGSNVDQRDRPAISPAGSTVARGADGEVAAAIGWVRRRL